MRSFCDRTATFHVAIVPLTLDCGREPTEGDLVELHPSISGRGETAGSDFGAAGSRGGRAFKAAKESRARPPRKGHRVGIDCTIERTAPGMMLHCRRAASHPLPIRAEAAEGVPRRGREPR
jgi:hypothetical protein